MDRNYWEKIAPGYNDEIFDVLKNDTKGIIRKAIAKASSPDAVVMDMGCAVGKWLPLLSPSFKKVIAVDISAKNLSIAKKLYPALENVEYVRADLSSASAKFPKADVLLCVNAILTDSMKKRNAFFSNISSSLKKEGSLILVVPSLESWLLSRIIQRKYKIDKGLFNEKISPKKGLEKYNSIQDGNADIDNVSTKHYLQDELSLLLAKEKLVVEKIQKIEYDWSTEFVNKPKWLQTPKPWDWLCVARKK